MLVLFLLAGALAAAAARELVHGRGGPGGASPILDRLLGAGAGERAIRVGLAAARLGVPRRLERAGMAERLGVGTVLSLKIAGALAGALAGSLVAPAAPGRLSALVLLGMPVAGFLVPDALLERRARQRLRQLLTAMPDALDLLAVGAAAGRPAIRGFGELAHAGGPLGRELGMTAAEAGVGVPQAEAIGSLRDRVPTAEVAALCAAIERSRRHGSPLAEQLRDQASSLRAAERRRIADRASRAAPKIQLAVALLLVPSVLLMIAAALLANLDRFVGGF